jgi:hypothetical protein
VGEDGKPLTVWRALRAAEFWLLLVAAMAAVFRVPWWVTVPLVMVGLSISSMPKYLELWPRARAVGAELEWWRSEQGSRPQSPRRQGQAGGGAAEDCERHRLSASMKEQRGNILESGCGKAVRNARTKDQR